MNKFFDGLNRRAFAVLLSLIMAGLAISTPIPCKAINLSETMEFASKIQLAAPLPSVMKVEDVKIQNALRISYILVNDEASSIQLNVPQGTLKWQYGNLTLQYASIADSLGNSYAPLAFNGSVMNAQLEVAVEPHTMYNLSLSMILIPGALYDTSYKAWFFGAHLGHILPIEATISLPADFSIPFYSAGAEYRRDQNYTILTWQKPPAQALNVTAVFLPFSYGPETKSLSFKFDLPQIFPIATNTQATMTQEFESTSSYNGLEVPQISEVPILFPSRGKDIQVTAVFDSGGQCNRTFEPISQPADAYRGNYYVDLDNQEVIVYPRALEYENRYEYRVSVTFDFGNDASGNVTYGSLMPYEGRSVFGILSLDVTGNWKLNMAQGLIVEFWLPEGTLPYPSNNYTTDYKDNRYIVRFVNAPSALTSGTWKIDFYIARLKNLYLAETFSIIMLTAILLVMLILHLGRQGTLVKKIRPGTTAGILIQFASAVFLGVAIIYEFNTIGDWLSNLITRKPLLVSLLVFQVILTMTVFFFAQKLKPEEFTRVKK